MSIKLELRRLRRALQDALWHGDDATMIETAITRLELLQSMGETYDLPY